ncbi:MAG: ATP-dependent RNA helicase DeaD [Limisphaerales bacterium]|jgi:ATP-dependent RNA helicase DeaD
MSSFAEIGLAEDILRAVQELGFETPTPIQSKTIPHLLSSDRDLLAFAQTGTGKTAAFGLPAIQLSDTTIKKTQTLILCPTRELCLQIKRDLAGFSKYKKGLKVVAVYGGDPISRQMRDLESGAHIVVGTPGRTKDLIERRKLKLDHVARLVLDEADEMLTMGFKDELDAILKATPEDKQTLLFSATMSPGIKQVTKKYMKDPLEVAAAKMNIAAENVQHQYYMVQAKYRYEVLRRIADITPNIYGIVFCRTRMETKDVANKLIQDGYSADAIHGELSQNQREEVMDKFRKKQLQILVATDVAARGLDVQNLTHVINYNLPDNSEVYVHRSGRTGRAGKSGISIAIIHTREMNRIREIQRRSGIKFTKERVPTGKDICEKQLFSFVEKIEKTEVDEKQIAQFLPDVIAKLEWMSKEQLIAHVVSEEFNRFLKHYEYAQDINVDESKDSRNSRDRDDRRDGRDRDRRDSRSTRESRDRGDRRESRDSRDRGDRRDSRDSRSERGDRNSERNERPSRKDVNPKYQRLFINVGEKQELNPARLIGLVNNALDSSEADIGKIEIMKKFSFFDIDRDVSTEVISKLSGQEFGGEELLLEESNEKPAGAFFEKEKKPKAKKAGSKSSSRSSSRPERSGSRSSGGRSSGGRAASRVGGSDFKAGPKKARKKISIKSKTGGKK